MIISIISFLRIYKTTYLSSSSMNFKIQFQNNIDLVNLISMIELIILPNSSWSTGHGLVAPL